MIKSINQPLKGILNYKKLVQNISFKSSLIGSNWNRRFNLRKGAKSGVTYT